MITESAYVDLLKNCAKYNNQLYREKRVRLPYLDAQTGLAQNVGNLWRSRRERRTGDPGSGVVYWYPARRWKKRKNSIPVQVPNYAAFTRSDVPPVPVNEGTVGDSGWFVPPELEEISEPDFDDQSDNEDYEESYRKKKRGKNKGPRKCNRGGTADDLDRPFVCNICGARYKTKPGLSYHNQTQHPTAAQLAAGGGTPGGSGTIIGSAPTATSTPVRHAEGSMQQDPSVSTNFAPYLQRGSAASPTVLPFPSSAVSGISSITGDDTPPSTGAHGPSVAVGDIQQEGVGVVGIAPTPGGSGDKPGSGFSGEKVVRQASPSKSGVVQAVPDPNALYCDFCLGTEQENKKTNRAEFLVKCDDCGRAGHPSCLQFTANMIVSTKKYGWQCIECKSCAICGTSENDDQLLFCDDCDKGYHMYCLNPPLSQPPEGSWSCERCLREFGPAASANTNAAGGEGKSGGMISGGGDSARGAEGAESAVKMEMERDE